MEKIYSVEELVIKDSFINYCRQNNPEDQYIWQNYLHKHPEELGKLLEARRMVKMITGMLDINKDDLAERFPEISGNLELKSILPLRKNRILRRLLPYAAAASIFVLFAGYFIWFNEPTKLKADTSSGLMVKAVYQTKPAERKTIWLPDSTKIMMNANTEINVPEQFGIASREVSIKGEAFFEVTHNAGKPFILIPHPIRLKFLEHLLM